MGFKISWLAVETAHKVELLSAAGLKATMEHNDWGTPYEDAISCADIPTGWTILFSNDFDYAAPEHLTIFTGDFSVLSCQLHEGIMYSACRCNRAGHEIWSVAHDSDGGVYDLTITGIPPPELAPIRTALAAKQGEGGIGFLGLGVDYIFDVPIGLIAALTGYRHDRDSFDWGEPVYMKTVRR